MTVLCDNCSPRKQCTADKNRTECKYYQPQTNEEWFCNLPTEEKAKYMCEIYEMGKNGKDYFMRLDKCVEWLKQPHHEKE